MVVTPTALEADWREGEREDWRDEEDRGEDLKAVWREGIKSPTWSRLVVRALKVEEEAGGGEEASIVVRVDWIVVMRLLNLVRSDLMLVVESVRRGGWGGRVGGGG